MKKAKCYAHGGTVYGDGMTGGETAAFDLGLAKGSSSSAPEPAKAGEMTEVPRLGKSNSLAGGLAAGLAVGLAMNKNKGAAGMKNGGKVSGGRYYGKK